MRNFLLSLILFFLPFNLAAFTVTTDTISEPVTWQGVVEVESSVTITKEGVLTIMPGTVIYFSTKAQNPGGLNVKGKLIAIGEPGKTIIFTAQKEKKGFFGKFFQKIKHTEPKMWSGISFTKEAAGSQITHAKISKARTALFMTNSATTISFCTISNNNRGIKVQQHSKDVITDCLFKNNREGILAQQEATPLIKNNLFIDNQKAAIRCIQATPLEISNNYFENNQFGVICRYPGANPPIEQNEFIRQGEAAIVTSQSAVPSIKNNRFTNNPIAIKVEKKSRPQIYGNRFEENTIGLYLDQGANASVTFNHFANNKMQAMFINNSSYPLVNFNNFLANRIDIRLGEHQSTEYEEALRNGEERRNETISEMQSRAPRRYSKAAEKDKALAGYVDARNNYWGDNQQNISEKKDDTNLANIIDYYDVPYRIYNNDKKYLQDKVEVLPFSFEQITIPEAKP